MTAGRICSGVMRAATDSEGPSIGFQLMEACVPGCFNGKEIMRVSPQRLLCGRKDQQNGILDHRHTDVCDFLYSLKVFVRSDYFVGTVCNSDPGY